LSFWQQFYRLDPPFLPLFRACDRELEGVHWASSGLFYRPLLREKKSAFFQAGGWWVSRRAQTPFSFFPVTTAVRPGDTRLGRPPLKLIVMGDG